MFSHSATGWSLRRISEVFKCFSFASEYSNFRPQRTAWSIPERWLVLQERVHCVLVLALIGLPFIERPYLMLDLNLISKVACKLAVYKCQLAVYTLVVYNCKLLKLKFTCVLLITLLDTVEVTPFLVFCFIWKTFLGARPKPHGKVACKPAFYKCKPAVYKCKLAIYSKSAVYTCKST